VRCLANTLDVRTEFIRLSTFCGKGSMNMDEQSNVSRVASWSHGRVEVQRLGAMCSPTFTTFKGRTVTPLYIAPWAHDPEINKQPPILQRLRGDFVCFPFGFVHAIFCLLSLSLK
jgi:hypothetical protein